MAQAIDERRRRTRKNAYSSGLIVSRDGALKLDCRVEDLTSSGAKVRVGSNVPMQFYLLVSGKEVAYEAHAIWTRDGQHGLTFVNTLPIQGLKDTTLGFLRNLKLERLRG